MEGIVIIAAGGLSYLLICHSRLFTNHLWHWLFAKRK
jgi:hypothetical protein